MSRCEANILPMLLSDCVKCIYINIRTLLNISFSNFVRGEFTYRYICTVK